MRIKERNGLKEELVEIKELVDAGYIELPSARLGMLLNKLDRLGDRDERIRIRVLGNSVLLFSGCLAIVLLVLALIL